MVTGHRMRDFETRQEVATGLRKLRRLGGSTVYDIPPAHWPRCSTISVVEICTNTRWAASSWNFTPTQTRRTSRPWRCLRVPVATDENPRRIFKDSSVENLLQNYSYRIIWGLRGSISGLQQLLYFRSSA